MPQEHNPRYHIYTNFLHKSALCNKSFRGKLRSTRENDINIYGGRGDLRMIRLFLRFMYFCSNFHASYCFFIRSIMVISPVPLFLCHRYRPLAQCVGCSGSGSGHGRGSHALRRSNTQPAEHRALRDFHFTHVNPACDWLMAVKVSTPHSSRRKCLANERAGWPRRPAPGNKVGHLFTRPSEMAACTGIHFGERAYCHLLAQKRLERS